VRRFTSGDYFGAMTAGMCSPFLDACDAMLDDLRRAVTAAAAFPASGYRDMEPEETHLELHVAECSRSICIIEGYALAMQRLMAELDFYLREMAPLEARRLEVLTGGLATASEFGD
jgi:hypothetical protein